MRHFIFDLDQTVIDSSHRTPMENGKINLSEYFRLRPNMNKDTLLPLSLFMKAAYKIGHIVSICTSRTVDFMDYSYLQDKGLNFHNMLSRPFGLRMADDLLKLWLIHELPESTLKLPTVMFDDNEEVLDAVKQYGIEAINSHHANDWIRNNGILRLT